MELTQDDIRMMRPTSCPWLFVAKLPYDRYWRVYTRDANNDGTMADWGDSNAYTGGWFTTKAAAVAYATELCESGNWHGFGHDAPTDQEDTPMLYHYRSTLRPITQLPLQKLDWEYCAEFVGPDVRDMLEIRGKVTGQDCNAVCWSAMGEQCKCKCGGTRHAAAYEILAGVNS